MTRRTATRLARVAAAAAQSYRTAPAKLTVNAEVDLLRATTLADNKRARGCGNARVLAGEPIGT